MYRFMSFGSERENRNIRSVSEVVAVLVVWRHLRSLCKCVHGVY